MHVALAVGGGADEIKCIFVKSRDIQPIHQLDFDVFHQIGAIHLNGLRYIVSGAGHGTDEDFELHALVSGQKMQ